MKYHRRRSYTDSVVVLRLESNAEAMEELTGEQLRVCQLLW